jgi:predicted nucleic acid-binding protein
VAGVIALDASALIALTNLEDQHHVAARAMFAANREPLVMSALTLAEFLVYPVRAGTEDAASDLVARLGVRVDGVASGDAAAIARVRAHTRLRMPDAVVLELALRLRGKVMTFDAALASAAKTLNVGVLEAPPVV